MRRWMTPWEAKRQRAKGIGVGPSGQLAGGLCLLGACAAGEAEPQPECGEGASDACVVLDGVCQTPDSSHFIPAQPIEQYGYVVRTGEIRYDVLRSLVAMPCSDSTYWVTIQASPDTIIPEGGYPVPLDWEEAPSGSASSVVLTVYRQDTGASVGMIRWRGDIPSPRTSVCDYIWTGSGEADVCVREALDTIRPLTELCAYYDGPYPPGVACPCHANLLTDDVAPDCVDTDGDGYWETPPADDEPDSGR